MTQRPVELRQPAGGAEGDRLATPPGDGAWKRVVHVERHPLGPRLFVLGRRLHECYAGLALLGVWFVAVMLHAGLPQFVFVGLFTIGAWLTIKDWRDLFPPLRDTAAWSVAVHRKVGVLRTARRGDWVPCTLALLAAAVGAMNLVSTLTPDIADRVRLLGEVGAEPMRSIAHGLAVPASVCVLLLAAYLAKRRRRAWTVAVGVLLLLGALNLAKGLDIEEAAVTWLIAGLLVWARPAFYVRQPPWMPSQIALRAAVAAGAAYVAAVVVVAVGHAQLSPHLTPTLALREAAGLVTMTGGPVPLPAGRHWFVYLPACAGIIALLFVLAPLFRPIGIGLRSNGASDLARARRVVEREGRDTLSFFKLRADVGHVFDASGRACIAYRVEAGVLLISGDPVGPDELMPAVIREAFAFAERRGLRVAVVGAGERLRDLYARAGMSRIYIGDEAIVAVGGFSLEGRAIRKVRQSVTRLRRAGYITKLVTVAGMDESEIVELESVAERWRCSAAERGFSMAMEGLRGQSARGTVLLVARDEEGRARGFLQFVPCFGRPAMSLSMMRRDPGTPNGLTEFMVVSAIELLGARGIEDLSLNFAFAGRYLRGPARGASRVIRPAVRLLDRWFQVERLYRFNAKFQPAWAPRYLVIDGFAGLPRAGIAALRAEGHLSWPTFGGLRGQGHAPDSPLPQGASGA